jgi:hypothetical protein
MNDMTSVLELPPGDTAGLFKAAGIGRGDATYLRCGGCGTVTILTQGEPHYGQQVHGFLGRHKLCGNAVEISRAGSRLMH